MNNVDLDKCLNRIPIPYICLREQNRLHEMIILFEKETSISCDEKLEEDE